jgi:hypothetical protein
LRRSSAPAWPPSNGGHARCYSVERLFASAKTRAEPSCFLEALGLEWWRIRDRMKRFLLRYYLSKYPKDLLRSWWDRDRCMPWPTSQLAFKAYKAGEKPGPLFKAGRTAEIETDRRRQTSMIVASS